MILILFLLSICYTRLAVSGELSTDEIKVLLNKKNVDYSAFTSKEKQQMIEHLKKKQEAARVQQSDETAPQSDTANEKNADEKKASELFSIITDSDIKLHVENKHLTDVLDTLAGREKSIKDLGVFEKIMEELEKDSEKELALLDRIKNNNVSFFIIFTDQLANGECANLRILKERNIPYFITSSREMAAKMNVGFPSTVAYNHTERVFYKMDNVNVGTVLTPLLSILSSETVKFIDLSKLHPFYIFIPQDGWKVRENEKSLENAIRAYARTKKNQFKFSVIKYMTGQTELSHFGIEQEDLPAVVHMNRNRQKFVLKGLNTVLELSQFIEKFENNQLEPFSRSAEIIDNTGRNLKLLVAKNHNEFLKQNTQKDVLLVYGSIRCPHCTKLIPVLEELSNNLKENTNVVVAYIDLEINDVDVTIEAFPTIMLYPATPEFSLEKQIKFADFSRTEIALKKFIKQTGNANKEMTIEEVEEEQDVEEAVEIPEAREMRDVKEEL